MSEMYNPEKYTPAVVEFVDIAGLVKGASQGEGLGNKFLSHIREVDAICHVVRIFEDTNIIHVEGNVDPLRDIETIEYELILSDMEAVERRLDRAKKMLKGDKKYEKEIVLYERILAAFSEGKAARKLEYADDELEILKDMPLLTRKPVIYVANISEDDIASDINENAHFAKVKEYADSEGAAVLPICTKLEAEIAELEGDEKAEFLKEMGLEESGLDKLIKAGYALLGLISFLTAGPKEVRAWTITKGSKAPQAAGKIHTDFERGFIRAEVIGYEELIECGSMTVAKEKGLVRSEGKEYVMKDGDVVLFRFNV